MEGTIFQLYDLIHPVVQFPKESDGDVITRETLTDTRRLKNTLYNLLQIALVQHWNGGEITNLMKKLLFLTSCL